MRSILALCIPLLFIFMNIAGLDSVRLLALRNKRTRVETSPENVDNKIHELQKDVNTLKSASGKEAIPTIPIAPVENELEEKNSDTEAALSEAEDEEHDLESEAEEEDLSEDKDAEQHGSDEGTEIAQRDSETLANENDRSPESDEPRNFTMESGNEVAIERHSVVAAPDIEESQVDDAIEEAEAELKKKPTKKKAKKAVSAEDDSSDEAEEKPSDCKKKAAKIERAKEKLEAAKEKVDKLATSVAKEKAQKLEKDLEDSGDEEEA